MNEPHSWGGSSWRELDREQGGLERGNCTGKRDKGLRLGREKAGRQQAGRKAGRAGQKCSQAGDEGSELGVDGVEMEISNLGGSSKLVGLQRVRSQIEGTAQSWLGCEC